MSGTILLWFFCAVALFIVGVLWIRGGAPKSAYYIPSAMLLAGMCGFFLPGRWRANVALLLLSLAPLPWAADYAMGVLLRGQLDRETRLRREFAARAGIPYDARTPRQVVLDLRRQGEDAWPAVHPGVVLGQGTPHGLESFVRGADGQELQPLGGISNVPTEYGNEEGRYLIYRSDEHGFHNPPGIWSLPMLQVAAVGDSFTQGASVPSGANMVDVVRRRWPGVLNLGYGGNGPLIELASLLEYLPQRRPAVVLWILCEGNDIGEDMAHEMASPLLLRYWREKRALQHLEQRQGEIDRVLRTFVDAKLAGSDTIDLPSAPSFGLNLLRKTAYEAFRPPRDQWDSFEEILKTADATVRGWNGTLYLVYLPVYFHEGWLRRKQRGQPEERRRRVLDIGQRSGIPVIDIDSVFQSEGSNAAKFQYPYRGHYTVAGYQRAGAAIVDRLETDRAVP